MLALSDSFKSFVLLLGIGTACVNTDLLFFFSAMK